MRKLIVISWLLVIFSGISFLFWYNEWQYSQPTPVPANYRPVKNGTPIKVSNWEKKENNRPVLYIF